MMYMVHLSFTRKLLVACAACAVALHLFSSNLGTSEGDAAVAAPSDPRQEVVPTAGVESNNQVTPEVIQGQDPNRPLVAWPLPETLRTLLIANNIKTKEYVEAWSTHLCQQPRCRIHVETKKTTDPSDHKLGESVPFFRFLQENYDDIKTGLFGMHIVLLSDKGRDWHSRDGWSVPIKTATPRCRTPLGMQLEDQNNRYVIAKEIKDAPTTDKDSEIPPILRLLNVFNLIYTPEANDGWCCVESVISREAILLYTKDQYKFAKEVILQDPDWKWGWALERIIGLMFNNC